MSELKNKDPKRVNFDQKLCPFLNKKCLGNECSLWSELSFLTTNPTTKEKEETIEGRCSINFTASLANDTTGLLARIYNMVMGVVQSAQAARSGQVYVPPPFGKKLM